MRAVWLMVGLCFLAGCGVKGKLKLPEDANQPVDKAAQAEEQQERFRKRGEELRNPNDAFDRMEGSPNGSF